MRSSQSFGKLRVVSEIMQICNLTEKDINKLNAKCSELLDIYVFKTNDSNNNAICKAHVCYNGNDLDDINEVFNINTTNNDEAKQENNKNFKEFIKKLIKDYKEYCRMCFL